MTQRSCGDLLPYFLVAKLGRPTGLRGDMRVEVLSDNPDRRTQPFEALLLTEAQADLLDQEVFQPGSLPSDFASEAPRVHVIPLGGGGSEDVLRMHLQGFEDRESVEHLRGSFLAIPREAAYQPGPGRWLISELIGLKAYDLSVDMKSPPYLGVVKDMIDNPANDLLQVHLAGQEDIYVPILPGVISSIDQDHKKILLTLPPGLMEVYRGN